jgi:hypothetical protein
VPFAKQKVAHDEHSALQRTHTFQLLMRYMYFTLNLERRSIVATINARRDFVTQQDRECSVIRCDTISHGIYSALQSTDTHHSSVRRTQSPLVFAKRSIVGMDI